MQLPDPVKRQIEERAEASGFAALKRAAAAMSDAYRAGNLSALARIPAADRVAAYLVTRMPATYAAAFHVLRELRVRLESRSIGSVLDLGAGTGAASLAARQLFPESRLTLIERDTAMSDAARLWLPGAAIQTGDLDRLDSLPPHDLVISAYSAGELRQNSAQKFWTAARVTLAMIEPGTPRGYEFVMGARRELLESGAHMLAPCPAETDCPLAVPDWCHFAARIERSSLHRRLKEGDLGYEDEKFSYVAVAREPVELPAARIIRRPLQEPGSITLTLCQPGKSVQIDIRKRDSGTYRRARRAQWGDDW